MINDNLFNTIFTCRTGGENGRYLIVREHSRVTNGVCYRGIRKVGIRGCNTRVFRADGETI